MEDELTPEMRLQAAHDWAASIQVRLAERFAGTLARQANAAPMHIRDEHLGKMRQAITEAGPDLIPAFEQMLSQPASPKVAEFDEPRTRELIQTIVDEVSATMAMADMMPGEHKLLVSSVPSGSVNAFCCGNTWDEEYRHVFVDSDLLIFCTSLAKIVATCFTRSVVKDRAIAFESPRILRTVRSPDVAHRIEDMYSAMVFFGTVRASEPWIPDAGALSLYISIATAMERFVVAHELSHLMLGHLDNACETIAVQEEAFGDTEAVIYSHEAEFEADAAGAILATETAVRLGYSKALTSIAPYIFLKGIEVLDACQALRKRASGGIESTHPSSVDRLRSLRAVMELHLGRKDPDGNLPVVLKKVDHLFYWIKRQAVHEVIRQTALGMTPRQREYLRLFEQGSRPRILGLQVDLSRVEGITRDISLRLTKQLE